MGKGAWANNGHPTQSPVLFTICNVYNGQPNRYHIVSYTMSYYLSQKRGENTAIIH